MDRRCSILFLIAREKAIVGLDDKFDLRESHNVVLKNGAVPLAILKEIIDEYIAKTLVR